MAREWQGRGERQHENESRLRLQSATRPRERLLESEVCTKCGDNEQSPQVEENRKEERKDDNEEERKRKRRQRIRDAKAEGRERMPKTNWQRVSSRVNGVPKRR